MQIIIIIAIIYFFYYVLQYFIERSKETKKQNQKRQVFGNTNLVNIRQFIDDERPVEITEENYGNVELQKRPLEKKKIERPAHPTTKPSPQKTLESNLFSQNGIAEQINNNMEEVFSNPLDSFGIESIDVEERNSFLNINDINLLVVNNYKSYE